MIGEYSSTFGTYPTEIPFGLQCNLCVTDFTPEAGATCFKLGSRELHGPPPAEWNLPHPYAGPEATQHRAEVGSFILYDARYSLICRTYMASTNVCTSAHNWMHCLQDVAQERHQYHFQMPCRDSARLYSQLGGAAERACGGEHCTRRTTVAFRVCYLWLGN
jgi:hypothetical protein